MKSPDNPGGGIREGPPVFAQVNLASLSWGSELVFGASRVAHARQAVLVNDQAFELVAEHRAVYHQQEIFNERYVFEIRDERDIVYVVAKLHAAVRPSDEVWEITTDIEKVADHSELLGVGMQLYGKILDVIPAIVRGKGRRAEHDVERMTSFTSKKPLANDRWNELFEPLLASRGYIKVQDGRWRKVFEPPKSEN